MLLSPRSKRSPPRSRSPQSLRARQRRTTRRSTARVRASPSPVLPRRAPRPPLPRRERRFRLTRKRKRTLTFPMSTRRRLTLMRLTLMLTGLATLRRRKTPARKRMPRRASQRAKPGLSPRRTLTATTPLRRTLRTMTRTRTTKRRRRSPLLGRSAPPRPKRLPNQLKRQRAGQRARAKSQTLSLLPAWPGPATLRC